jgi:transposase
MKQAQRKGTIRSPLPQRWINKRVLHATVGKGKETIKNIQEHLEGINSKVQLAKRRAKGYRNTDNFINMIYFLTTLR